MSLTERVEFEVGGQVYCIRELGFLEFGQIHRKAKVIEDEESRGMELMRLVMLASVETIDGKAAFDEASIFRLKRSVFEPLSRAALKAQGMDIDKPRESMTAEEAEGNE